MGKIELIEDAERVLGLHLLQFAEVRLHLKQNLHVLVFYMLTRKISCDTCSFAINYFTLFFQIVEEACTNLLPNVLCEYLYSLSEDFTGFYSTCQVRVSFIFLFLSWMTEVDY